MEERYTKFSTTEQEDEEMIRQERLSLTNNRRTETLLAAVTNTDNSPSVLVGNDTSFMETSPAVGKKFVEEDNKRDTEEEEYDFNDVKIL